MAVALEVPESLRELTGGVRVVRGNGATLEELLRNLEQRYPRLVRHLRQPEGTSRFFAVRIGGRRLHLLGSQHVPLSRGDTVRLVPGR